MNTQASRFNRWLLILMAGLYGASLLGFSYANWRVESQHILWMHLVNAVILSIPLILFFGAVYVLMRAWREHSRTGRIDPRLAKLIHWAPRVAAIAIIVFITLFSLDAFGMDGSLLERLGAFLMHSVLSILLIVLLAFAWRWPLVGCIAFLAAGLFFLRFVIFGFNLGNFLLFSGPLLLVSALFYADWRWRT